MDIGKAIGANLPAGTYPIMVFVPSQDVNGNEIDRDKWTEEALSVLGTLFRGATGLPGFGVWRDDKQGGRLIHEEPVIIFCLANPEDVTDVAAKELRKFLHRLGRETNQGEVGVVIEGTYFGITDFDSPEA